MVRERWQKGPAHTFVPVEELTRIDEAAKLCGMTRAMFLRMAANAAAADVLAGRVPPWFARLVEGKPKPKPKRRVSRKEKS